MFKRQEHRQSEGFSLYSSGVKRIGGICFYSERIFIASTLIASKVKRGPCNVVIIS